MAISALFPRLDPPGIRKLPGTSALSACYNAKLDPKREPLNPFNEPVKPLLPLPVFGCLLQEVPIRHNKLSRTL